jgi:hypothetical protein
MVAWDPELHSNSWRPALTGEKVGLEIISSPTSSKSKGRFRDSRCIQMDCSRYTPKGHCRGAAWTDQ